MSGFGPMVRQMREAAGIRQVELARRLGVSQAHLSGIEVGRARVTLALVRGIANSVCLLSGQRTNLVAAWSAETPRWTIVVADGARREAVAHLMVDLEDLTDADLAGLMSVVSSRRAA